VPRCEQSSPPCSPRPDAPVALRELPLPDLQPGEALLRVACSEVCGTDVHLHRGRHPGCPYPLTPAHVAAGRLDAGGAHVRDVHGRPLRAGDAEALLDVHGTCGACWFCLVAKATTRCPHRRVYGITQRRRWPCGGWATHVRLFAGTRVIPLGDLAPRAFLAGGCALPTALHAGRTGAHRHRRRGARARHRTGRPGADRTRARRRRGHGAGDRRPARRGSTRLAAAAMGVDAVLDFATLPAAARAAWVREQSGGRGADVVIEATGAPDAVVQAMRCARDAGRVVVVGQYTDHGEVDFNPHLDLNKKHLEVLGCWGSDYSHFHRAVQVAGHPRLGARGSTARARIRCAVGAALDAVARGDIVRRSSCRCGLSGY
jgi:L-iditol 2-dehydrogenase